ncbi:LysR family transcriptional regulator [Neorhizobium galegae]|uniref:HTH-type transcriptional regulator TtuA n=1 Tax=Neorhizobium galegae TaxID=399 RepID=A0A6A1TL72_NEOGA|nr:LysR family transcriptional regulator [Neorhizobium galegae]KAB1082195.1 LysR family transcriptional regulator [Neorhizobium galegae]
MVEFKRFRYFLICAEELHFTRAAEKLGIAQPPLSQQIKLLEREIGTKLFNRTTRGVELTRAGESLLSDVRAILAASKRAIVTAQQIGRGEAGSIRVGFTGSVALNPLLSRVFAGFRQAYPLVDVQLAESTTRASLEALRNGQLDFGFIRPSEVELDDMFGQCIHKERMYAAVPIEHPLASSEAIQLSDLSREAFVLYPRANGQALYDAVIGACQRSGFSPRIVQEAPQMTSTVSLVAAGVGVTLVTESMRQLHNSRVRYLGLVGVAPVAETYLVRRVRPVSPIMMSFQTVVASILAADAGNMIA